MRGFGAFVNPALPGMEGHPGSPATINADTISHARPERFKQPVYDRVNIPTAVPGSVSFFATPVGGTATLIRAGTAASISKTVRDTWLRNQGVLPQIAWWATSVYFILIPSTVAPGGANTPSVWQDVQLLVNHGYVEFKTVQKTIFEFALTVLRPWTGTIGGASTVVTADTLVGAPISSEQYDLMVVDPTGLTPPVPLFFERNQNFSATMFFDGSPTLSQTFDIVWVFESVIERPS